MCTRTACCVCVYVCCVCEGSDENVGRVVGMCVCEEGAGR